MDYKGIADTDWYAAYRTRFWEVPTSEYAIEAAKYKISEAVFCGSDIDTFAQGIQSGAWAGQYGVGAGNAFDPLYDGSLPGSDGTGINHAQTATGGWRMSLRSGKLELQGASTWGDWGPLNGL